jgi:hypothetical protein
MLVTMADHSEHAAGQDLAPLPRKAAKRRRIQLLEGSSSILQPYPCTEGAPLHCSPCRRMYCVRCDGVDPCLRPHLTGVRSLALLDHMFVQHASACSPGCTCSALFSHMCLDGTDCLLCPCQTGGRGVAVLCWRT